MSIAALLLLVLPLSTLAEPTICATQEQSTCNCEGTVHYGRKYVTGNGGKQTNLAQLLASPHVSRHETSPVSCSNTVFGDPMVGTKKYCFCLPQANYTFSPLVPGNFSITSAYANTDTGNWKTQSTVSVTLSGKVAKVLTAGAVKYQVYQTGVTSFIASGNSDYFTCDNKGCDLGDPIALKLKSFSNHASVKGSDYTLSFDVSIPTKVGTSNDFRVVFWGQDQDHSPYDFTATLNFSLD